MVKTKDPKVGTGKKPKGSGRRLYTDENPKDTVSIKFATLADARATVAKVKRINKPYARKIQICRHDPWFSVRVTVAALPRDTVVYPAMASSTRLITPSLRI